MKRNKLVKTIQNPYELIQIADFQADTKSIDSIITNATIQTHNGKSANFELAIDTVCYDIILDETLFRLFLDENLSLAQKHNIIGINGRTTKKISS